ncbi:choice-of-anchor A domain-containing protein [Paenibacillus sp. NFR01]|nr:choice-of-anchor A domain-containing protein [Paenibacillus sp. NFR01]
MMKRVRKKKLMFMLGLPLALLLAVTAWGLFSVIDADQTTYPVRLLEVTESGQSELGTLKTGLTDFTVVTMSMKRFVALREDLDGEYDAVYIGKGVYSPTKLTDQKDSSVDARSKAMNTSAIENDITKLRADDITNLFINKGLPVIFNKAPFEAKAALTNATQRGILYDTFNPLRPAGSATVSPLKPNVLFFNDTDLANFFTDLKSSNSVNMPKLKKRPLLQITNSSEIASYDAATNGGHIYQPGEKLTFRFSVSNTGDLSTRPLTAKLYLNLDKSIAMTEQDVVAAASVDHSTGSLEYTLPRTYSGLLYWKLEIGDPTDPNQLKDYENGSIRYHGEKTIVNVLQIMPDTSNSESSLLSSSNMTQSFLNSTDYQLNITVKKMAEFKDYIKQSSNNGATANYGLNGVYDMLLFGFKDEYYKSALMDNLTAAAVKDFINVSKQSVMFTHDTIINIYGDNEWIHNFKDITGQKDPVTNLGHNATNTSTKVTPVNDGLLMQYPFYLSKQDANGAQVNVNNVTPTIATTHNQYLTLDLEDREVVSWYNILGSATYPRTPDDSWNHYYTYSKGNVTYSGTGHTSTGFPVWEQKLFVNTMYRAFMGANHKPQITVYTPASGAVIPSYQDKLTLSFSVADLDFKDRNLQVNSIKFYNDTQEITSLGVQNLNVRSEEIITRVINNPLPDGGNLTIVISAQDKQGAITTVSIPVTIQKVDSSLSISRTQSSTVVEKLHSATIDYSIVPKTLPYDSVATEYQGKSTLVISDLKYEEKFPAGLEFRGALPSNFTKTGTLDDGYTISGTFNDITYNLTTAANGTKTYVPVTPAGYRFTLTVEPQIKKSYVLDNSKITFKELHEAAPAPTAAPTPTPGLVFPGSTAPVSSLGLPTDYSVYILENIEYSPTSFQNRGRTAAGGSVKAQGLTLAAGLPANQTGAVLVAGTNLYWGGWGGSINGRAYYGGTLENYPNDDIKSKTTKVDGDINNFFPFTKVSANVKKISADMGALSGTAVSSYMANDRNNLTLTGTDPTLNVFNVTLTDPTKVLGDIAIKAPATSTVIINFSGTAVKFNNGSITYAAATAGQSAISPARVLFNFNQATSVIAENYEIKNSLLAPLATLQMTGTFRGSLIAKTLQPVNSNGEDITFEYPFEGTLPAGSLATATPTPTPTATPVSTALPVQTMTMYFPRIDLEAVVKVTGITLNGATLKIGDTLNLIPQVHVVPEEANNQDVNFVIVSGGQYVSLSSDGILTALAAGTAEIKAVAKDGSNVSSNIAQFQVISPEPVRSVTITGSDSGTANQPITLHAEYSSSEQESNITYTWTVRDSNGNIVNNAITSGAGTSTVTFTPPASGGYTVTVTVNSSTNTAGTSGSKNIAVTNPLTNFDILGGNSVFVGKTLELTLANPVPANADAYTATWGLGGNGTSYAGLTKSPGDTTNTHYTLTGNVPGTVTVVVSAGGVTKTKDIQIIDLTGLTFSLDKPLEIYVGDTYNLNDLLWFTPRDIQLADVINKLNWVSAAPGIASFSNPVTASNRGIITGNQSGSTDVTVTYTSYTDGSGQTHTVTATLRVKVLPRPNGDRY